MIRLSPLQIVAGILLICLLVLAGVRIRAYGEARYEAGQAEVQGKWDKAVERGRIRVEELKAAAGKVTVRTETVYQDRVITIREKGNAIVREVPVFVPDGSCDMPGGFRLLHDAAAGNQPVPDAADIPDAAPVTAQDAAATVAGNYATCHQTGQQLISLQDWVRDQCKANPPPEGCGR